ncbi:O-methyltransferase [Owenweeksia hongkongensis]|uniref:O-methyltransferase n=1 Tax=Owenweeksia hongkongensis TaxID=253245 RepID=UPI003A9070F7
MDFLPKKINTYSENHTSPESEVLENLNRDTQAKILRARMLSGHLQGRTLSMFSHMLKPKRILEIGTYTGYSAICLAEGLTEDGVLHTIDINEELEDFAKSYFDKSEYGSKIKMHVGDALEIIPSLNEAWDMVFIDADKANYSNYFHLVIEHTRTGGFIIADNVLWSGKVVEPVSSQDIDTKALIEFNNMVTKDERVENVLLPIRDGLMVARKK